MVFIGAFVIIFLAIMAIGFAVALAKNGEQSKDRKDADRNDLPRVIVTQEVPSVFDTFKRKK